jgi:hypothetical protein
MRRAIALVLLATLQGSDGFGALPKLCDASDVVEVDGSTNCERIRPCLEGFLAANDLAGGISLLLALPFIQGVSAPDDILAVAGSDLCALKVMVELLQRAYADWPEFAPAWGTATGLYFTESLGWTIAETNDFSLNIANLVAPCSGADSSMCRGFMQLPYVPGPLNCAASAGPNEDLMLCARGYAAHHWLPAGQNLSPLVLCDPTGAHGCAPLYTCCPKDDPSDVACDVCPGGVVAPSAIGGGVCRDPVSNGFMGISMYPGCALCAQPGEANNKNTEAKCAEAGGVWSPVTCDDLATNPGFSCPTHYHQVEPNTHHPAGIAASTGNNPCCVV